MTPGVVFRLADGRPRGGLVDLGRAALEVQLPGVVTRHVVPGDAVQVGQALLPVVRVLHQLERLALVPEVPLERAGADRVGVELRLGLAAVVVRDDVVGEDRQVGEQRRPRELQVDDHGVGRRVIDRGDRGVEVGPAGRGLAVLVDRELHVGRGHRLAVGELDAGPELERVGLAVSRLGVAGGEVGPDALAVVRHRVQRLEDLLEDPDRVVVEHSRVVHRLRVLGGVEDQVAAVHRCPGVPPPLPPPGALDDELPPPPHAARTTSALAAIRALAAVTRNLTQAP